ncbi:uncharacterized protein LOC134247556 isoform X2 [Saccostrea cucullata]|uniref:uncharacterized protein LOC134247556 isoform X2 n=1 Tax=Saccostrea cuccullata TaxID=36930 RepID=UPI002ED3412A
MIYKLDVFCVIGILAYFRRINGKCEGEDGVNCCAGFRWSQATQQCNVYPDILESTAPPRVFFQAMDDTAKNCAIVHQNYVIFPQGVLSFNF